MLEVQLARVGRGAVGGLFAPAQTTERFGVGVGLCLMQRNVREVIALHTNAMD